MSTFYNKRVGSFYENTALEVKTSIISGKGVFATQFIKAGSVIMKWEGQLFTHKEILEGKAKINSVCGFKENIYIGQLLEEVDTNDQFLNHSCDPNIWMKDELTVVARRDICAGTEVTADYAIWEIDSNWVLPTECQCRSNLCRRTITGNDWKLHELQLRYQNHFLPCLNRRIESIIFKSRKTQNYKQLS